MQTRFPCSIVFHVQNAFCASFICDTRQNVQMSWSCILKAAHTLISAYFVNDIM